MIPARVAASLLLVNLCACLLGCRSGRELQLPDAGQGPRLVRTGHVEAVMSEEEIQANGTAGALSTTKVMPLVPGLIKQMPIKEGDLVQRNQVLAVLDQRQYQLQVRQAEAALDGAKIALQAATREKQRFDRLLKVDATAKAQYDQILDKYQGATIQLKQAQVAVDMAHKALGDTVLRAPYAGVVVKKMASVGDYATTMPPTVILMLMEISTLELKVGLPEPELQRVAPGAKVQARFASIDRTVEARVSRVIRSVDPLTRSFEAIVEIPNPDLGLKPGLYAGVKIAASGPRRKLLVPSEAVVDEGSDVYAVFVLEGNAARRREVRVTAASDGRTEIVSGLQGGETVILDASGLLDGDPVQVKDALAKPTAEAAR